MADVEDKRWPGWVYRDGEEPDYRFSFANERTFLAWIRTGLALIAAGVAVDAFDLDLPSWGQHVIAATLVVLGALCATAAWSRWARAERAMRRREPLPSSWSTATLAVAIFAVAVVVLVIGM